MIWSNSEDERREVLVMLIDLTTEKGADIAAGMRGPDFGSEGLKYTFTAYLRYLAGYEVGTTRRYTLQVVEIHWLRTDVRTLEEKKIDINHYMAHVHEAAVHLMSTEELNRFAMLIRVVRMNLLSSYDDEAVIRMAGGLDRPEE